ncbi:MAG TPA: hypothetical protein VFI31_20905 [Pirellulales bacterium]|nr:hypothetical protein [Pirellulales bacterium]
MLLDEATYAADGLSGDHVRELACMALQHAILRTTTPKVRCAWQEGLTVAIDSVAANNDAS